MKSSWTFPAHGRSLPPPELNVVSAPDVPTPPEAWAKGLPASRGPTRTSRRNFAISAACAFIATSLLALMALVFLATSYAVPSFPWLA